MIARRLAFVLSLILITMTPLEGVAEVPGVGSLARVIGFAMFGVWAVSAITTRQFRKPASLHVVFYLFVSWNILSVFWSADPDQTISRLVTWVQLLALVLIIWDLYRTRAALLAALQAYVLGAYVAVGVAIASFVTGRYFYSAAERYSAGDTNPDEFGLILALGIPVAWYLATINTADKRHRVLVFVNYAYVPAALLGIALSGTRTALIATVPGMVFGFLLMMRLNLLTRISIVILVGTAVAALAPAILLQPSVQRLTTTGTAIAELDFNGRTELWADGFDAFLEHPILGVGSNAYRSVTRVGKVAHNSFISVLVETGIVGFVLLMIMLTIAAGRSLLQPKWDRRFWLLVLMTWGIGASSLTFEHRKPTWLFISLLMVSTTITAKRGTSKVAARQPLSADRRAGRDTDRRPPPAGTAASSRVEADQARL